MTIIIKDEVYTPPAGDALMFNFVIPALGREAFIIDPVTGKSIAGVRVTDQSINSTAVDLTDGNSDGFRELHSKAGLRTYDYSITGVLKDGSLRDIANESTGNISMTGYKFKWADGTTIDQDYVLTEYTENFPMNDAVNFSATILTSGQPLIS